MPRPSARSDPLLLSLREDRIQALFEDRLLDEPATAFRTSRGQVIAVGDRAEHGLFCTSHPFGTRASLFEAAAWPSHELLTLVLETVRDRLRRRRSRPDRVVVSASPDLLLAVRPRLPRAAAAAGLHEHDVVEEVACLRAALVPMHGPEATLVHVGSTARVYATGDAKPIAGPGITRFVAAVLAHLAHRGLRVTPRHARALLFSAESAWPRAVKGMDVSRRRPARILVGYGEIVLVLTPIFECLLDAIREAAGDARARTVLTGLGSAAPGFLPVLRAGLAGRTVAHGERKVVLRGLAACRPRGRERLDLQLR